MKLAFCLFRYFPFGGIQRDFLRIAEVCARRGHELHLFTLRWDGPAAPFPLQLHLVDVPAMRNHRRYEQFAKVVEQRTADGFDLVIGFNKMPHLDVYFAGDPCFVQDVHQRRSRLYRLSGRYRHFRAFERAVFAPEANVEILLLAEAEQERFQQWYATPTDRFHVLPPTVAGDRFELPDREQARRFIADDLGISQSSRWLLMIGSSFATKGVDRAIRALAALPAELRSDTLLLVVGQGRARAFERLSRRLGVQGQVHLLQGRSDVPQFLAAADAQLHVSRRETAGMAIIEAIAARLPIIVTAACGYASHVQRAGSGIVLPEPFKQAALDTALANMLNAPETQCSAWREAARRYVETTDLTGGTEKAVDIIEQCASRRAAGRIPGGAVQQVKCP